MEPFAYIDMRTPELRRNYDACNIYGFTVRYEQMIILSVHHRGLKRLIEDNQTKGIRPDLVNRIRNILTALILAEDMGACINSQGTEKTHGACPRRETGESPLKRNAVL